MTEIAVILGSYQSARHLPDCLESIRRQVPAPAELIVVDAASSDGSADIARGFGATVIESENRGLGFLYNTGARAAAAPYVLVANTDIALEPDCLGALGAALAADDRRFAADPQQLDWSATRVIHARTVGRRGRLLASPIPGFAIDPLVPATSIVPTLSANAGAMLVRRDLLLELGGFDERFFLEYEDLDLCWRAWQRGWESVYVPKAVVRHHVGGSTAGRASRRRLASSHASIVRLALKCLPGDDARRVIAGEALRLARHPRSTGAGLLSVLPDIPRLLRERARVRPSAAAFDELLATTSADA